MIPTGTFLKYPSLVEPLWPLVRKQRTLADAEATAAAVERDQCRDVLARFESMVDQLIAARHVASSSEPPF